MLSVSFDPFPVLSSPRLLLRQITTMDRDAFYLIRSNPETMRYIPRALAATLEDVDFLIQKMNLAIANQESINWVITLKDSPTLIGVIGFVTISKDHHRAEIGYVLMPEYQGQGIMDEAVKAVVDYGFNVMQLHQIEAIVMPANQASRTLLEKNKFTYHSTRKEYVRGRNGQFEDTAFYTRMRNDK